MKKLVFLFILGITNFYGLFAQELDFKVKIDTIQTTSKVVNLTVFINGGQPDYTVYIMDDVPYEGGKIISYGKKLDEKTYFFSEIKLQNYFVCILDEKKSISCKKNNKFVPVIQ